MLTDRGKLLLASAAVLWLVGRSLAIDAALVAAAACVALVGVAVAYTRITSARLSTHRHVHPNRLFFDTAATVDLEIRNDGRLSTALLLVQDTVPAALAGPPRFVVDPLLSGRSVRVRYELQGRQRGQFTVGPATVRLRDPFGVAQRPVRFGHADEVIVYPPVWLLPPTVPRIGRHGAAGDRSVRPLSASGEFANVREYIRGDDLRKVHWKSTAHRGKLMVKQDESSQRPEATLLVDLRRAAHRGSGATSTFEQALAAAASAAYHLAQRRYTLRLVTGPVTAPPTPVSWELVLEQLATVHPQPGTTLVPLWQQVSHGLAGDGLLVAITPVPDAVELREMVRAGRRFADRVAVVVAAAGRQADDGSAAALVALRGSGWRATAQRPGGRLDRAWHELSLRARPHAGVGT